MDSIDVAIQNNPDGSITLTRVEKPPFFRQPAAALPTDGALRNHRPSAWYVDLGLGAIGGQQPCRSAHTVSLFSRETIVATASSAAQAAPPTMPVCFTPLPLSASVEELRQQMIAMTEAYQQLQKSSHQYHLQQQAEITGRLKHMQTQLETRGKSRVSVKPSLFGDVTS